MKKRNDKIYCTEAVAYRKDGMLVYLPTRSVFINSYNWLSACCFKLCPFSELTCNKCKFSVL